MSAHFNLPTIIDHTGWGPVPAAQPSESSADQPQQAAPPASASASASASLPTNSSGLPLAAYQPVPAGAFQYAELPFQPFNKNDKLWRVSDWTSKHDDRWSRANWGTKDGMSGVGILGTDGAPVDEDPEAGSFSLVDNRPTKLKSKYGRTTFKRGMMSSGGAAARRGGRPGMQTGRGPSGQRQTGRGAGSMRGGRGGRSNRGRGGRSMGYGYGDQKEPRESSVELSEDWAPLVQDIDMSNLGNFVADVEGGEDIDFAGTLEAINPKYSRTTPRNAVTLQRFENRQHFTATTADDPILQQLASKGMGNVYATDTILSALMASSRSVNSWDILIRKEGDNLFLDKRPTSRLDYVSVNENWNESFAADKENINHPDNLATEATFINHNFAQQLTTNGQTPPHHFETANPFLESLAPGQEPASVAFRYRKWNLPGGITLVARCSLNGFVERRDGEKAYVMAKALNEFDSKLQGNVDWRQKLESQTGAVLAAEMKNNQYKLGRWVSECVLSGCDELRLGFVSRVNPKSAAKHAILMCKSFKPEAFADSVHIKPRFLWGTLAHLLTTFKKLDDGNYVMVRDPNKSILHIHSVPRDAFDHELEEMEGETQ